MSLQAVTARIFSPKKDKSQAESTDARPDDKSTNDDDIAPPAAPAKPPPKQRTKQTTPPPEGGQDGKKQQADASVATIMSRLRWLTIPGWLRAPGYFVLLLIGLIGFIFALVQLVTPRIPLNVERTEVDNVPNTPITVFTNNPGDPGPAVVLAHGFAGSQQLMYAFATTLAHNGYTAVTLDFPGHGQNVRPLQGGVNDAGEAEVRYDQLVAVLDSVVAFASDRERSDGRVALLGHAMGSEAVVRYASTHPDTVTAVVAVSPFPADASFGQAGNVLVLAGSLDFGLQDFAQEVADSAADGTGETSVTYGSPADGNGRRVVLVPGTEHIGILFNRTSMNEALAWLDASFQRTAEDDTPYLDGRAPWLVVLYLSALLIFWPFTLMIRRVAVPVAATSESTRLRWIWFAIIALVPAIATPVILWLLPIETANLLQIVVGGSLVLHFAIYGLLTAVLLLLRFLITRRKAPRERSVWRHPSIPIAIALLVIGFVFLLMGLPSHFFVLNYFPPIDRLILVAIIFIGLLPYFFADEWLTRGAGVPTGAYILTKLCLLLSLGIAIVLSPEFSLLFLLAPLFAIYFLVYGLISWRVYRRTGTIWIGALANSFIFAWIIATVFPLVA